MQFAFIIWQVDGYRNILKLSCRSLAFSSYQVFQKMRKGLELMSLPHFPHSFWRKTFILLYSINWQNFIVYLSLLCEILGNVCIAIFCKPGCDIMNFEVNLVFLIKPFFLHDQNVVKKSSISWERKKLFRRNKKHFFIIFEELSIKQIQQIFLEGGSPTLKFYLDEKPLTKNYLRKHLILLKIQSMPDMNITLLQWSINL